LEKESKMKKLIVLSFVAFIAVGSLFLGCGNPSGGSTGGGSTILSGTTWKYFGSSKDKQLQFSNNGNSVSFKEIRGGNYTLNGTYTISGKNVAFTFSELPGSGTGVISEDGKSMTVNTPMTSTELFVKQ
jgi:hypothetical protein